MKHWMLTSPVLRVAAIVIALAGAVDPAITSNRSSRPNVTVISGGGMRDSALAERVAKSLEKRFTVYRGAFSAADAVVIAGDRVPASETSAPTFAVLDKREGNVVTLDGVRAPAAAPAASRVPIEVTMHVTGARGKTVELSLRAGPLVIDRATRPVTSDDQRDRATLTYVPPAAGVAPLRVAANIAGSRDTAVTDVVVDVHDRRWSVLFYDPRPSWMSTFVRRAAERDERFVITSRVVTSRDVSTDAGQPPARLDDFAALGLFDAIVVGAPEALTDRDVSGLDAFMRRRGGAVLLLLDHRASGAYDRLVGADRWITDSTSRTLAVVPTAGDSAGLRASELAFPARPSSIAVPLALTSGARADSLNGRAAIWQIPVGAGRLVVSGALDSWRYRDRAISAFDRFWQSALADAASSSPLPVDVRVSAPALRPAERAEIDVSVRDAALSANPSPRAIVSATLESDSARPIPIRLWPSGAPGRFSGSVQAPAAPGVYRVNVKADGASGSAPVVVLANASHPTPSDRDLVDEWVASRGGRSISADRLGELPALLTAAVRAAPRAETWHPMRSAWWIVPFALALSAEWWMRRRRGLP